MSSSSLQQITLALPWAVAVGATCAAAVIDVRVRRVPNWLTLPLLLGGLIWGAFDGGLIETTMAAAMASAPFIILWVTGGSGAGDAKLMMGVGAWAGLPGALFVLLFTALAGGVISLIAALRGSRLGATLMNIPRAALLVPFALVAPGRVEDRRLISAAGMAGAIRIPYGVAICAGTWAGALWMLLK